MSTLRVGAAFPDPPFNGMPDGGLDIDLMTEIGTALGATVEFVAYDGADFNGIFEGLVKLEIGPLGDFAQLVGLEDAVGQLGASDISVERFSEGRATLSVRLDQPVELLRELEELSTLDFKVRHTGPDNLILDVDEDSGEQRAA